jgi:hypothetical protein
MLKEEQMTVRPSPRQRPALLACGVALLIAFAVPTQRGLPIGAEPADAATYPVYACNDAGGANHSWGQYYSSGSTNLAFGAGCPNGGYRGDTNSGIFVRSIANGLKTPYGALGGWRLNAPSGNSLNSIAFDDWYARVADNGYYSMLQDDFAAREGCWNGTNLCGTVNGRHSVSINGSSEVRIEVGCFNISGCQDNGAGTGGIFELYGATVTVNDNTTPTVAPSGSLWTGAWQRGVRSIGVTGSDGTDGIQANQVVIDGQQVLRQDHGCDFTYTQPCGGTQADSWNYDTSQLSDGAHSIQANTYDAGWLGYTAPGTIYVDNHAPSKPMSITELGTSGWRSSNDFSLSWSDPSQGNASPIAAVHYSLCQASNPSSCPVADQRVAGTDINALTHVAVPGAGDYVLHTWLEDAAGNVDPSATSDQIHLMYDPTAPGMAAPQHDNGWFNAQNIKNKPEHIALAPNAELTKPISGIAGYAVSLDGTDPGTSIDVTGSTPTYSIADLPEGRNVIKARAISGAGVPSSQVGLAEIDVDKTPPTMSDGGAPDPEAWQSHSVTVTVKGADQPGLSGMGASPDSDVHDGAYMSYRVDRGAAQLVPGGTAQIPVGGDGDHTVAYQAHDFAGNPSIERSQRVRVDTTAPSPVVFEAQIPGDPRRLIVAAADKTSGLGSGVIEMRKQGTAAWQALPTARLGDSEYTTYLDDTTLDPNAKYEFRARVKDVAGNEGVGSTYANGAPVVLPGQVRTATHLAVGFGKAASKCKAASKHKKASKRHARRRTAKAKPCSTKNPSSKKHTSRAKRAQLALQQAVASARRAAHKKHKHHNKSKPKAPAAPAVAAQVIPFGKRAAVAGTLTTVEGAPIANQVVAVYAALRSPGSQPALVGHVRTDAHGAFRYVAPAGASRTLDFRFEGTDTLYPSDQPVRLLVPASTTLRPSKRSVRNGHTVRFAGRLRGLPLPDAGKLVNLQVFYRGKWRTFATPRTNGKGVWRFTYRFQATRGVVTYRFRAAVKREAAYPYELGYSKLVSVTVRG